MLVLSRERSESILIGDNIKIMVVEIRGNKVRIGVEAPKDMPVYREEIAEAMKQEAYHQRVNEALRTQSKQHSDQLNSADVPPESPGES